MTGDLGEEGEPARIVERPPRRSAASTSSSTTRVWSCPQPVDEIDGETWDTVLGVNLRAAFFAAQAAVRHMREAGGGRIVSVSSQAAAVAIPSYLPYGVSKAGLEAMGRLPRRGARPRRHHGQHGRGRVRAHRTRSAGIRAAAGPLRGSARSRPQAPHVRRRGGRRRRRLPRLREADFTTGSVLTVDGGYLAL